MEEGAQEGREEQDERQCQASLQSREKASYSSVTALYNTEHLSVASVEFIPSFITSYFFQVFLFVNSLSSHSAILLELLPCVCGVRVWKLESLQEPQQLNKIVKNKGRHGTNTWPHHIFTTPQRLKTMVVMYVLVC